MDQAEYQDFRQEVEDNALALKYAVKPYMGNRQFSLGDAKQVINALYMYYAQHAKPKAEDSDVPVPSTPVQASANL